MYGNDQCWKASLFFPRFSMWTKSIYRIVRLTMAKDDLNQCQNSFCFTVWIGQNVNCNCWIQQNFWIRQYYLSQKLMKNSFVQGHDTHDTSSEVALPLWSDVSNVLLGAGYHVIQKNIVFSTAFHPIEESTYALSMIPSCSSTWEIVPNSLGRNLKKTHPWF